MDAELIQVCVYVRHPVGPSGPGGLAEACGALAPTATPVPDAPTDPERVELRTGHGRVTCRRLPPQEVRSLLQLHRRVHADVPLLSEHLANTVEVLHLAGPLEAHLEVRRMADALAERFDGLYLSTWWYRPGGRHIESRRDHRTLDEAIAAAGGPFLLRF